MDMLDIALQSLLEWVYNPIAKRYGRLAAWLVTLLLFGSTVAILFAVVWHLTR